LGSIFFWTGGLVLDSGDVEQWHRKAGTITPVLVQMNYLYFLFISDISLFTFSKLFVQ